MTNTGRVPAAASAAATPRVQAAGLVEDSAVRIDEAPVAGDTARVGEAPAGGQASRVHVHHFLMLEGDQSGHLMLEGDVQSGGDALGLEGDEAHGMDSAATRRVTFS